SASAPQRSAPADFFFVHWQAPKRACSDDDGARPTLYLSPTAVTSLPPVLRVRRLPDLLCARMDGARQALLASEFRKRRLAAARPQLLGGWLRPRDLAHKIGRG